MSRVTTIALVLSILLNIALSAILVEYNSTIEELSFEVRTLREENEHLKNALYNISREYRKLTEENIRLKRMINTILQQLPTSSSTEYTGELQDYNWIPIFGVYTVTRDIFSYELKGIMMKAYLRIVPGKNRVFIATTPKIGIELQASAEKALKAALKISGVQKSYDVYIIIKAEKEVQVVDGPSAGAAIAVMITALLRGDNIRKDVGLTGTIDEEGNIGPVGGVLEKALVAAENGIKVFLVPKGQSKVIKYIPSKEKIGFLEIVVYRAVRVDLEEELRRRGYYMEVEEVSTLTEAYSYFVQVMNNSRSQS